MTNRNTYDLVRMASQIAADLHALADDEEPPADLLARMYEHATEAEEKIEAIYHVRQRMTAEVELLADEEKRLKLRRKRFTTARERVEGYAYELLKSHEGLGGGRKVQTPRLTVWLRKSGGKLVLFDDFDVSALPEDLWTRKPNNARIKAAIEGGQSVEGAQIVIGDHVRWS